MAERLNSSLGSCELARAVRAVQPPDVELRVGYGWDVQEDALEAEHAVPAPASCQTIRLDGAKGEVNF